MRFYMPLTAAPGGFFYSTFGFASVRFLYFGFYNYSFGRIFMGRASSFAICCSWCMRQ
nr:MAG TPA: hypothetical protein [Caudoviricetes sp.]